MRRKTVLHIILGLLLFGSLAQSYGQRITLMEWTNEWRYLQSGVAAPANWFASNFVDTTWTPGRGVLGFPANENVLMVAPINTILNQTTNGAQIRTYYFRTSLTLTNDPTALAITASNVIDDGAVFYVNGREVQRVAMPAPPTAISYTTDATRQDEVSTHGVDVFTIASSNFVQGVNRIAVELHQGGIPSSDAIFGMKLFADILEQNPPVITIHPQDREVDVPAPATFTVAATGTAPLTYRWYTNGVLVPGQSGTSYTISPTSTNMNGRIIHASVSNRFGIAISSNAVLTAVIDRNGPLLTSALSTSPLRIEANFNESLRPGNAPGVPTTNLANYVVNILGTTNKVPISSLTYGVNRMLLSLGAAISPDTNYVLCVYNLQDTKTNATPQDCIGVSFIITTNVVSFGERWRWNQNERAEEPTNSPAGVNWKQVNYNDDPFSDPFFWSEESAPLYNDFFTNNVVVCEMHEGWTISRTPITQYMRKRFVLDELVGNATMNLRYTIDDGAIFYINGTEVFRYNMPAGPVFYSTYAASTNDATCLSQSLVNFGHLLVEGTNVLAIEVHQVNQINQPDGQHDVWFDAELTVTYRRTPQIPALNVARVRSGSFTNIIVTWLGTGWQLQHAVNPAGPWTNLASTAVMGTNRYQGNMGQLGPRRFYRVRNP